MALRGLVRLGGRCLNSPLYFSSISLSRRCCYSSKAGGVEEEDDIAAAEAHPLPPKKPKKKSKSGKKDSSTDESLNSGDALLIKALKTQLDEASYLQERYQKASVGSFKPFEVLENENASDLTLRRLFGKEEVLITCLLDLDRAEEEGEDAGEVEFRGDEDELNLNQCLTLNIQISKGPSKEDPKVLFLCSYARGEKIMIEDVAYSGHFAHENYPYSGRGFQELSDSLKEGFQNVVKARGINPTLANIIMDHLIIQYGDEYISWLQNVRRFLKQ